MKKKKNLTEEQAEKLAEKLAKTLLKGILDVSSNAKVEQIEIKDNMSADEIGEIVKKVAKAYSDILRWHAKKVAEYTEEYVKNLASTDKFARTIIEYLDECFELKDDEDDEDDEDED